MLPFLFVGNHPCLDFVNTRIVRSGAPLDLVANYMDLVGWAVQGGLLSAAQKAGFARWAGKEEGRKAFERAISFRGILRDAMEKLIAGKKIPPSVIKRINELLQISPVHNRIVVREGRFELQAVRELDHPLHLLALIAETAADLFCRHDLSFIKQCENPRCILFFYDESKNRGRRWCSMSGCGNRMKVAAYYDRRRKQKTKQK